MEEFEKNSPWGISLDEIPPEGLQVKFEDLKEIGDLKIIEPLSGHLFLKKRGIEVWVKGSIKGSIELTCDLCLENFLFSIDRAFEVLLQPKRSLNYEGEKELSLEELEVSFYENSFIDYLGIIYEELLLTLPFRNICREGCKGLCPVCGTNLNKETCRCVKVKKSSPFAVLKELRTISEKSIGKEV